MKLIFATILLSIIAIAIFGKINSVTAEDDEESSSRSDFFQCDDGQEVIADDLFCDGQVDCKDESDESEENCKDITCSEDAFRCKYGACVSKDSLCDKVDDCVDRSDETDPSCEDK